MNRIKKLYSLSQDAIDKLENLKKNNPDLSSSMIVDALIMTAPDDVKIDVEHIVKYSVT